MLSEVFLPRLGRSLGRSLPRPWIKWFKCHPKISKGYLHSSTGTISTSLWHLWQVTSMQRRERRKSPSSAGTNNRCFSLRFSLFFSRSQQWHQTDLVGFDRLRQPQRSPLDHLNLDRWKMLKTLGTIHLNWTIVLKNIKLIQIENDWIFEYELTQSKAWIRFEYLWGCLRYKWHALKYTNKVLHLNLCSEPSKISECSDSCADPKHCASHAAHGTLIFKCARSENVVPKLCCCFEWFLFQGTSWNVDCFGLCGKYQKIWFSLFKKSKKSFHGPGD